ncbi:putative clathrin assembly protein At1g03050 [Henckelia pumila]|uniref:putative clathrin assembly protein At1g03050 n=1 Tax=Henckelia pumila TaxID=405737 RepID=UPI003C6DDC33
MAPSKIKKAIGSVKDRTSIGLAKVGSSTSLSDIDVAIVKATRHEEYPPDERYIREILTLTSYSHAYVGACVSTIAKRLSKTKNWVVALKTLMLIQRLLSEGDIAFEQEIFFATRRGTRLLNMSDFRDKSGRPSSSWDFSAFVRTYALYLDEKLEFRMQGRRGKKSGFSNNELEEEGDGGGSSGRGRGSDATEGRGIQQVREMKNEKLFSRVHHLMQLLERFLACKPTGASKHNRVVSVAFYPILKESFHVYYDTLETMAVFLDRFPQLDVADSVKVYELFCRLSKQYEELDALYDWSKTTGIARSSEFPDIEKIPKKRLDMLNEYIEYKSAKAPDKRASKPDPEPKPVHVKETEQTEDVEEEYMRTMKALPPPEGFVDDQKEVKKEDKMTPVEPKEEKKAQMGALVTLSTEDKPNFTEEEAGNRLALALFDGHSTPSSTTWEAFKDSTGDWETSLVQNAAGMSIQKAASSSMGGFDGLVFDGMYQHVITYQTGAANGHGAMGLRANMNTTDPFAASLAVAPPAYVQMREMETRQRLVSEEQVMWQRYARDGMRGHAGFEDVRRQEPHRYPRNY